MVRTYIIHHFFYGVFDDDCSLDIESESDQHGRYLDHFHLVPER